MERIERMERIEHVKVVACMHIQLQAHVKVVAGMHIIVSVAGTRKCNCRHAYPVACLCMLKATVWISTREYVFVYIYILRRVCVHV
jgi:hypothetical protein